jgi:hypothetical protein
MKRLKLARCKKRAFLLVESINIDKFVYIYISLCTIIGGLSLLYLMTKR